MLSPSGGARVSSEISRKFSLVFRKIFRKILHRKWILQTASKTMQNFVRKKNAKFFVFLLGEKFGKAVVYFVCFQSRYYKHRFCWFAMLIPLFLLTKAMIIISRLKTPKIHYLKPTPYKCTWILVFCCPGLVVQQHQVLLYPSH